MDFDIFVHTVAVEEAFPPTHHPLSFQHERDGRRLFAHECFGKTKAEVSLLLFSFTLFTMLMTQDGFFRR